MKYSPTQHGLRAIWHHKLVLVISTILVTLVALGVTLLQSKEYEATAKVLFQPSATDGLFVPVAASVDATRTTQTEIQVILSERVARIVQGTQKYDKKPTLIVKPVGQTNVIAVSVRDSDATRAAVMANAFSNAYIEFRRSQTAADLTAARNQLQNQIATIEKSLAEVGNGSDAVLVERRTALLDQQTDLVKQANQLEAKAATATGGAQIVTAATEPGGPISPSPARNAAVGFVVGALLGIALALLFERFGDAITSVDELDDAAAPFRTVATVPRSSLEFDDAITDAAGAGGYKALVDWVRFQQLDRGLRLLEVTSAVANPERSTMTAGLALNLAVSGQRVLVVAGDAQAPHISDLLDVPARLGLGDVLVGNAEVSDAIHVLEEEPRLAVLASGQLPRNAGQMLASNRAAQLFAQLKDAYDLVVVDTAPHIGRATASPGADAAIVVVAAGQVSARAAARTAKALADTDPASVGFVLLEGRRPHRPPHPVDRAAAPTKATQDAPGDVSALDVSEIEQDARDVSRSRILAAVDASLGRLQTDDDEPIDVRDDSTSGATDTANPDDEDERAKQGAADTSAPAEVVEAAEVVLDGPESAADTTSAPRQPARRPTVQNGAKAATSRSATPQRMKAKKPVVETALEVVAVEQNPEDSAH